MVGWFQGRRGPQSAQKPQQQPGVPPVQGQASTAGTGPMAPNTSTSTSPGQAAGAQVNQQFGKAPQPGAGGTNTPQQGYNNAGGQGTVPPPGNNGDIDAMVQQFVQNQLSSGMDTSKQEALIRQMSQQQLGQQQQGARAAAGRSGMGMGALSTLEGDQQRQAAQQALGDVFGVRQQAIQNAQGAAGLDIQEQNAANQKTELDARLAALQSLLGNPTGGASGGGTPGGQGTGNDTLNNTTFNQGAQSIFDTSGLAPTKSSTLASGSPPPAGVTITKTNPDGTVVGSDGKTYKKDASGKYVSTGG